MGGRKDLLRVCPKSFLVPQAGLVSEFRAWVGIHGVVDDGWPLLTALYIYALQEFLAAGKQYDVCHRSFVCLHDVNDYLMTTLRPFTT